MECPRRRSSSSPSATPHFGPGREHGVGLVFARQRSLAVHLNHDRQLGRGLDGLPLGDHRETELVQEEQLLRKCLLADEAGEPFRDRVDFRGGHGPDLAQVYLVGSEPPLGIERQPDVRLTTPSVGTGTVRSTTSHGPLADAGSTPNTRTVSGSSRAISASCGGVGGVATTSSAVSFVMASALAAAMSDSSVEETATSRQTMPPRDLLNPCKQSTR